MYAIIVLSVRSLPANVRIVVMLELTQLLSHMQFFYMKQKVLEGKIL